MIRSWFQTAALFGFASLALTEAWAQSLSPAAEDASYGLSDGEAVPYADAAPVEPPVLGLAQTAEEAIAASPDLYGAQLKLEAAEAGVQEAQSGLLPQAEVLARDPLAERDAAAPPPDAAAQHPITGGAAVTQVIFSAKARAQVDIQQRLLEREAFEHQAVLLDTVLQAALDYLQALRAQAEWRIQLQDIEWTRTHLDLARSCRADSGDALRWESRLATAQREAAAAERRFGQAKTVLNAVRGRPQGTPFALEVVSLDRPAAVTSQERLVSCLDDVDAFERLQDFMVREGLDAAPELARFDAAIAAQERLVQATRREFYTPTVALKGEVSQRNGKHGGEAESGLSLRLPMPLARERDEDTKWDVGIRASVPLYSGGARRAAQGRATAELEKLRAKRRETADNVEGRIRAALLKARASQDSLREARDASTTALASLEGAVKAYRDGSATLVDLLDAQNAALAAELGAAGAVHAFLTDLQHVGRAAGRFDFLMSDPDRDAWYARLDRSLTVPEPVE